MSENEINSIDLIYPDPSYPYYIVAPPYTRFSAGVRVLHLLCHTINRRGKVARIVSLPGISGFDTYTSPDLMTPLLDDRTRKDHFDRGLTPIMVYPEVIAGNPFKSNCVVRFLGNFPGLLGGDIEFNGDELCFSYSQALAAHTRSPENVLFMPVSDVKVFRPPAEDILRQGTCFYADKYKTVHKGELFDITNNSFEITRGLPTSPTPQEIAYIFQHSELFYVYENTALATEAILCGCPVVFLPNPHLTAVIASEEVGQDGYAWGTDAIAIERAKATVKQGAENYLRRFSIYWKDLDRFIEVTQKHAEARPYFIPIDLQGHCVGVDVKNMDFDVVRQIAVEVWYEHQRWGIPYKISKWLLKLLNEKK